MAPGFIDLHQHALDEESIAFKIRDGVTSVLELEVGAAEVAKWYAEREGKWPVNFGVSVGHIPVRMKVMGDFPSFLPKSDSKAATEPATDAQIAAMKAGISKGLDEGAVAVGFGVRYTPVATPQEILEMFRVAGERGASCHVHLRDRGDQGVRNAVSAAEEVIAAAALSGFFQRGSGLLVGMIGALMGDPVVAMGTLIPLMGVVAIIAYLVYRLHPHLAEPEPRSDVIASMPPGRTLMRNGEDG